MANKIVTIKEFEKASKEAWVRAIAQAQKQAKKR